ncbi:hypothetical protein ACNKHR_09565 [Shigella flexneri]
MLIAIWCLSSPRSWCETCPRRWNWRFCSTGFHAGTGYAITTITKYLLMLIGGWLAFRYWY